MEARFDGANGRNRVPRCRLPYSSNPAPALVRGAWVQALRCAQRLAGLYLGPLSMRPTQPSRTTQW